MPSWATSMLPVVRKALILINNRQRQLVSVRTGAIRHSIGFEAPTIKSDSVIEGVTFAGGAGAPYAKPHEYGSGLHSEALDSKHQKIIIVPVYAKALAWARSGTGPSLPVTNSFARSVNMHLGSVGGPNLRLSGNIRSFVRKALDTGAVKSSSVFNFSQRVVQEGQYPHSFMRRGLAESLEEVTTLVAGATVEVLT
jgi:hypothetical protein